MPGPRLSTIEVKPRSQCPLPPRERTSRLGGRCTRFGNLGVPTGTTRQSSGLPAPSMRMSLPSVRRSTRFRDASSNAMRVPVGDHTGSTPSAIAVCVVPSSTTTARLIDVSRSRCMPASCRRATRRGRVRRCTAPRAESCRTRSCRRRSAARRRSPACRSASTRRRAGRSGRPSRRTPRRCCLRGASTTRSAAAGRGSGAARRRARCRRSPSRRGATTVPTLRRWASCEPALPAAVRVRQPEVAAARERDERAVGRVRGILRVLEHDPALPSGACATIAPLAARSMRASVGSGLIAAAAATAAITSPARVANRPCGRRLRPQARAPARRGQPQPRPGSQQAPRTRPPIRTSAASLPAAAPRKRRPAAASGPAGRRRTALAASSGCSRSSHSRAKNFGSSAPTVSLRPSAHS